MPLHLLDNLTNLSNPDLARTALGSGAVGDDVFTADTEAAAHTAIGLYPISTQEFLSGSGTIALPTGARYVSFTLIAGGAGGGSGARGATSTARSGGTGGRAGALFGIAPTPVTEFTWPVSYVVGAGGAGGAAITADNTSGDVGVAGDDTTITSNGVIFKAVGGARGNGGPIGSGAQGAPALGAAQGILGYSSLLNMNGSVNSNTGSGLATGGFLAFHYPTSGGTGGSISTTNSILAGAPSVNMGTVNTYQVLGGLRGEAAAETGGNGNQSISTKAGTGGGGGRTTAVTFAGNAGGNGALYGGGGGGGSASVNGQNSGAGGNGADGRIQITFWY
jgi:hypothetical protein